MEVTFRRTNYALEFSEKQLRDIFSYLMRCLPYEAGILGFSKSGVLEMIPDIWTCESARSPCSYIMSGKMADIVREKERLGYDVHHFHSHPNNLPFPSPEDPYLFFETIGVISLGDIRYADFRIFRYFDHCPYPPLLGSVMAGRKLSTLVRFDKKKGEIQFAPPEEKVSINALVTSF